MLQFTGPDGKSVMMLPAGPGRCEICNWEHNPEHPHNADTVFYQMRFYYENGRWPTWTDAMEHCRIDVVRFWTAELEKAGVTIGEKIAEPKQATLTVRPDGQIEIDLQDPNDDDGVIEKL